jgi:hypothetical protein
MRNAIKKNRRKIQKAVNVCNSMRFVKTGNFLCESSRCVVMQAFDIILFVFVHAFC